MASVPPNRSHLSVNPPGINVADGRKPNNDPTPSNDIQEKIDYLSDRQTIFQEISYSHGILGDEWRVNFAGLHRMILAKLQEDLIDIIAKIGENGYEVTKEVLKNLEPTLARYTTAVRDWEYMVEVAARADDDISKDLFVASSVRPLSHKLLIAKGVIKEPWRSSCKPRDQKEWDTYLPGGQRRYRNAQKMRAEQEKRRVEEEENKKKTLQAQFRRFWTSIFGGIALIAPMLLMVLHMDRTTTLATTSGAVFLFAVIVARYTTATPEVAIGAVSAYAAVLVVFVGSALKDPE